MCPTHGLELIQITLEIIVPRAIAGQHLLSRYWIWNLMKPFQKHQIYIDPTQMYI